MQFAFARIGPAARRKPGATRNSLFQFVVTSPPPSVTKAAGLLRCDFLRVPAHPEQLIALEELDEIACN
jgi:hypothetical protein